MINCSNLSIDDEHEHPLYLINYSYRIIVLKGHASLMMTSFPYIHHRLGQVLHFLTL